MSTCVSSSAGKFVLRGLLFFALAAVLLRTLVAQSADAPQLDLTALDSFIQEQMVRHRIPGLALGIVKDGEIVHLQGYGEAGSGAVTPQSRFYIGSISKSFTALAVMQLAESGQIDLDSPVQRYLPGFTVATEWNGANITVRHLLHQTSGLSERGLRIPWASQSLEDAVQDLRRAQPMAAPGEAFHYFNANYQVLGLLVEEVSGLAYADYVQQYIFAPLAMENSSAESGAAVIQGYGLAMALPLPLSEPALAHGVPSGYIISTAEDMVRYLSAQLNGGLYDGEQVLSAEGMATLHTPSGVEGSSYGMGWESDEWNGDPVVRHGGDLLTFHADVILLPKQGMGVVLLINQNNLLSSVFAWPSLSAGVIDLLMGQTPEPGLPVGFLSLIVTVVVVLSLVRDLRGLVRLRNWEKRVAQKSSGMIVRELLSHAIAMVLPFLLSMLLSFLLARTVTLRVMFAFLPDLTLLLIFEAILAALLLAVKVWLLARYPKPLSERMGARHRALKV